MPEVGAMLNLCLLPDFWKPFWSLRKVQNGFYENFQSWWCTPKTPNFGPINQKSAV